MFNRPNVLLMLFCFTICYLPDIDSKQAELNVSKNKKSSIQSVPFVDSICVDNANNKMDSWLKYYEIDINEFLLVKTVEYSFIEDPTSAYCREYNADDDIYQPNYHDYSPDKKRYVNLMETVLVNLEDDGRLTYMGSDDCQQIYLVDREKKEKVMISFRGISSIAEAVFWLDDDVFVLADYNDEKFSIQVFDILNKKVSLYQLNQQSDKDSYLVRINMMGRNVIFE